MTKQFNGGFDDSDMKIALPKKAKNGLSDAEIERARAEMEAIRKQGVLLQAEQVGAHMAAMVAGTPNEHGEEITNQQMWLSVFGVTVGCECCVHNPTAARTVLNAFHSCFSKLCPQQYHNPGYSAALSFYYLAVRSVGDSKGEIARTFAMLCGEEANEAFQKIGLETYEKCLSTMEHLAEPLNKQEDE